MQKNEDFGRSHCGLFPRLRSGKVAAQPVAGEGIPFVETNMLVLVGGQLGKTHEKEENGERIIDF